jgi:hypothetical protein
MVRGGRSWPPVVKCSKDATTVGYWVDPIGTGAGKRRNALGRGVAQHDVAHVLHLSVTPWGCAWSGLTV